MRALRIALPAIAALTLSVSLCADELGEGAVALEHARAQRLAGNLRAAGETLERFLGKPATLTPPDSSELHRELGEIELLRGRAEAAASRFEEALRARPDQSVVHYQAGIAYRKAGNETKAADHLDRAVELGFRTTSALLNHSAAHFAIGRFSQGLRSSRELLSATLQSPETLLQIGRQLFTYLFYADALQAFEGALALRRESYEASFFLALTNYLLNRDQEVLRVLNPLVQGAATAEAASLLGSALARQSRVAEAEALLLDTIESYPNSPHAYLNLALVLLDQGLTDRAEKQLDALRAIDNPESPKVFYTVRESFCDAAVVGINGGDQSLILNSDRAAEYFEMAQSLAAKYHHGTAVQLLRLARRYGADTPRTLRELANSCLHLEPHSDAPVRILEALIRMVPAHAEAHHLLGRAHLRQGRVGAAVSSHRAAVSLEPRNSRFRMELGRALVADADETSRGAAIQALTEASDLGPRNAVARYELGKLLMQQGQLSDAQRVLEEAINLEPEFHNAYYALSQVHIRAGQPEAARPYLSLFREKKAAAEVRTTVGAGFASSN